MKIIRVIPRIVRREMGGRVWNPRTRWQEKVMVLVFLEADSGHVGVGEAWNTAASPEALVATIHLGVARQLRIHRVPHAPPVAVGPGPDRHARAATGAPPSAARARSLGLALTPDDV